MQQRFKRTHAITVLFLLVLLGGLFVVNGQEPGPLPQPTTPKELTVPPVTPNFRAEQKQLPELGRVGVNLDRQHPLSLRDALSMALENNKDIEVARANVRMAEFDLLGTRGAYDPHLSTTAYYERIKSPISSFLSGGQNGSTIQSDYTGSMRLEGQSPKYGGSYRLDFSSVRLTTNNQFVALNPQY